MDFGILLVLLLVAIDGVIGIHVLQMPIVACTLMGLVTGNVESAIAAGASSVATTVATAIAGNAGIMSALSWAGITAAAAGSAALFGGLILGTIAIAAITGAVCKYISKKRIKEKAKLKAYDQIKEETQKSKTKVNNKGMAIQSQKVQISDPQNLESTVSATNQKSK